MEQGAFLLFYEQHKETLYHYACTLTANATKRRMPCKRLGCPACGRRKPSMPCPRTSGWPG